MWVIYVSLAVALPAIPLFALTGMGEAAISSALYCVLLLAFILLRRWRES